MAKNSDSYLYIYNHLSNISIGASGNRETKKQIEKNIKYLDSINTPGYMEIIAETIKGVADNKDQFLNADPLIIGRLVRKMGEALDTVTVHLIEPNKDTLIKSFTQVIKDNSNKETYIKSLFNFKENAPLFNIPSSDGKSKSHRNVSLTEEQIEIKIPEGLEKAVQEIKIKTVEEPQKPQQRVQAMLKRFGRNYQETSTHNLKVGRLMGENGEQKPTEEFMGLPKLPTRVQRGSVNETLQQELAVKLGNVMKSRPVRQEIPQQEKPELPNSKKPTVVKKTVQFALEQEHTTTPVSQQEKPMLPNRTEKPLVLPKKAAHPTVNPTAEKDNTATQQEKPSLPNRTEKPPVLPKITRSPSKPSLQTILEKGRTGEGQTELEKLEERKKKESGKTQVNSIFN